MRRRVGEGRLALRAAGGAELPAAGRRPARVDDRRLLLRGGAALAGAFRPRRRDPARYRAGLLRRAAHRADPGRRGAGRQGGAAHADAHSRRGALRAGRRAGRAGHPARRIAGRARPDRRADRRGRGPVHPGVVRDHAVAARRGAARRRERAVHRGRAGRLAAGSGAGRRSCGRDPRVDRRVRGGRRLVRPIGADLAADPPPTRSRVRGRGGRRSGGRPRGAGGAGRRAGPAAWW